MFCCFWPCGQGGISSIETGGSLTWRSWAAAEKVKGVFHQIGPPRRCQENCWGSSWVWIWPSSFFPLSLCTESMKADHTILKILSLTLLCNLALVARAIRLKVKTGCIEGTIRWWKELHLKSHVPSFYPDSQYTAWDWQNSTTQVEYSSAAKSNSSCIAGKFSQVFWSMVLVKWR